jgi:hypothetical protein
MVRSRREIWSVVSVSVSVSGQERVEQARPAVVGAPWPDPWPARLTLVPPVQLPVSANPFVPAPPIVPPMEVA